VNSKNRNSYCHCSLFSKKNPVIRIFRTFGYLAVPINLDNWSSNICKKLYRNTSPPMSCTVHLPTMAISQKALNFVWTPCCSTLTEFVLLSEYLLSHKCRYYLLNLTYSNDSWYYDCRKSGSVKVRRYAVALLSWFRPSGVDCHMDMAVT
jgi:hypothetical protein